MSNDAPHRWGRLGRLHPLAPFGLGALGLFPVGMTIYAILSAILRGMPIFYIVAAGAAYMAFTVLNLLKQASQEGIAESEQVE